MPEQEIPCSECEPKKQDIEMGGVYRVTECNPIPGKEGWCMIQYEIKDAAD